MIHIISTHNSLDNASHIVMLELKGNEKCSSTTFPGRGELEYFWTGLTSTMPWMTDRYLKAEAILVVGNVPTIPQKKTSMLGQTLEMCGSFSNVFLLLHYILTRFSII